MMSQTHELISKVEQITIEIYDIKDKKKASPLIIAYSKLHNHKDYDPLQRHHEEHDKGSEHYIHSIESDHPPPDSKNTQGHCVPLQCLSPKKSTLSPALPPPIHPPVSNSETLAGLTKLKTASSISDASLKIEEDSITEKLPEGEKGYVTSTKKTCSFGVVSRPPPLALILNNLNKSSEELDWDLKEGGEEGVEDPFSLLMTTDSSITPLTPNNSKGIGMAQMMDPPTKIMF